MLALLGKGEHHACGLYRDWFTKGEVSDEAPWIESQARGLVREMISFTDFSLPEVSLLREEGDTVKYLLRYGDGRESESVLIPMQSGITLCISSQVGCKMGCAFCETGKMGLLRSLSVEEIVSQVFIAMRVFKRPVRNIVFMGMGEPLDNFDCVKQAIAVLTDPCGMGFGPSRITVSTSGVLDGLVRFTNEIDPAVNLAVSVNAPNDSVRSRLMPVNKRWDMAALKEVLMRYCENPRRQIFAEYVLIKGINDSVAAAEELGRYLEGLRVRVNLIAYNAQSRGVFAPPDEAEMDAFAAKIREMGYQTLVRHPKGRGIMAACGQLGKRQKILCKTSS
ncbi:MAG: 23S rRNA (adenine(2503)-C(2))-methyltransferase RlmN [Chlamydiales bacterium]|nr:23S rRNA (adenine(2503)-C(2))-methyltransferase RlmN [Chlamydiales bacterium]